MKLITSAALQPLVLALLSAHVLGETPTQPATTQPADVVLVRIGDRMTLTQAEVERAMKDIPPGRFASVLDRQVLGMTRDKLFLLYLEDNPDLLTEEELEAEIQRVIKQAGVKTHEEALARLKARDTTYEEFRLRKRYAMGYAAVIRPAAAKGEDLEHLKAIYEQDPQAWDGGTVRARQIMAYVPIYDDPPRRQAKRERIERIREDLLSGRRTWEEALQESEVVGGRPDGDLGYFTRHLKIAEPLAEAAFALEVGQISDVIETDLGFHLVHVIDRRPGIRKGFEDGAVRQDLRQWVEQDAFQKILRESRKRHPVVGVQPPTMPKWVVQALEAQTQPPDAEAPRATQPAQAETDELRATAPPADPES